MRTWGLGQTGHVVGAVNPFEAEELALLRDMSSVGYLGDLPLIVLTRGRADESGVDAELQEAEHRSDQARQAALARNSRHYVVEGSGHHIAIENPEMVARAIRKVLAMQKP